MFTLPTESSDCKFHVECLTFRLDVQHQQCCESVDEVAYYFAMNGFVWTGQRFYREARRPGECPLLATVLDQSTRKPLSPDDLGALVAPLFFRWAESSTVRNERGMAASA